MVDCIEKTGQALSLNNQGIVKYLCDIEEERKNLDTIIQKQYQERRQVEAEIERLTYKLCLINKSLSMRIKAKNNYDKTIEDIKEHYDRLVDSSNKLRQIVEKSQQELDDIMNKKTGTNSEPEGEEIQMLYQSGERPSGPGDCPCSYVAQIPTKEKPKRPVSQKSTDDDGQGSPNPSQAPSSVSDAGSVKQFRDNRVAASSLSDEVWGKDYSRTGNPSGRTPARIPSNVLTTSISKTVSALEDRKSLDNPTTSNTNRDGNDKGTKRESSDFNKKDQVTEQFGYQGSDVSKNLLLSRLKAGDTTVKARQSTTVSGRSTEQQIIIDQKVSEEQENKYLKRGLDDVLRASSPRSSYMP